MTTEETELTFIRCPSCRSLVPAVATRCRMCGYNFDKADEASDKAEVKEEPKAVERKRVEKVTPPKPSVEKRVDTTFQHESNGGAFRLSKSEDGAASVPEEAVAPRAKDDAQENTAAGAQEEVSSQPDGQRVAQDAEDRPKRRRRRRRKKKPLDGELAETEESQVAQPESVDEAPPVVETPTPAAVEPPQAPSPTEMPAPEPVVTNQVAPTENTGEPVMLDTRASEPEPPKREQPVKHQTSPVQQTAVAGAAEGTLMGWFVNFGQDPKGVGGEIRAGKFFIGRQRLRGTDMVIADSAISTPHCLVYASASGGLQVQDLMSEQGTFLRRSGSDSFVRINDPVRVEHGDRLRFGAYEVMVCLVPG